MRKFSGPYNTIEDAEDQSEAAMRALADARGVDYPVPPGDGGPTLADPTISYATHATEIRVDIGGSFWIGHTDEIMALPDVVKRVNRGRDIRVDRVGVERPENSWGDRDPPGASLVSRGDIRG